VADRPAIWGSAVADLLVGPGELIRLCATAEDRIRRLDVGPPVIQLLADLSLSSGESAWTKPALTSFFEDEGEAQIAELYFSELKELVLGVRAIHVERRYAPWARTNAIADLPASTFDPTEAHVPSSVWWARWVGVCSRLSRAWEKVEPFLQNLAEETPVLSDSGDEGGAAPLELGVVAFLRMVRALVEPGASTLAVASLPSGTANAAAGEFFLRACREVPSGAAEWALRSREIRFADAVELRFLRFPRLGELRSGDGASRLHFSIRTERPEMPPAMASAVGAYVEAAAPVLAPEVLAFADHCGRALDRFKQEFASELVELALATDSSSSKDSGD
jgi:hypothetical protein